MKPRDVSLGLKHISILRDTGIHAGSIAQTSGSVSIELTPTANVASLIVEKVPEHVYGSARGLMDQLVASGVDPQANSIHLEDITEARSRYPLVAKVAQVLWAKFRENENILAGLPQAFQPTREDLTRRYQASALALAPETL